MGKLVLTIQKETNTTSRLDTLQEQLVCDFTKYWNIKPNQAAISKPHPYLLLIFKKGQWKLKQHSILMGWRSLKRIGEHQDKREIFKPYFQKQILYILKTIKP